MSVFWLIPAQDQLQDVLAQSSTSPDELPLSQDELTDLLEKTFDEASAIIVVERINGYSRSAKNHVLRVEYIDKNGESHAAIVKIANSDKLSQELNGWQTCGRLSNDRGVVLMPVKAGMRGEDGLPRAIVYGDARQRLRAARLINFEDAALTCCRWNDPDCVSVEQVLGQVFVELCQHLYQRAHAENDPARLAKELTDRLQDGIAAWESPHSQPHACRQIVMNDLPGSVADLLDPLDYLPSLLSNVCHLPEVMRGCAHGDLHGRNIFAGIDREKATFGAVFDYEDMGVDLLLGWDFAKLETELKVRAFQHIYLDDEADFIQKVYEFEERLAKETRHRNKSPSWGPLTSHGTPADRLFALLISIRGRARESLALETRRSNSWLHEYNFLLAAYGIYTGKFAKTYGRRQFLSTFISASVASAQHAWAKNASPEVVQKSTSLAAHAIAVGDPSRRPGIATAENYRLPFAFAKEFCRSRQTAFVAAGIEALESLQQKFPYVLEIWQELALAHLELRDLTGDRKHLQEAKKVLYRLDTRYPRRTHEETLCRQGRMWKDCGDIAFDEGDPETGLRDFQNALDAYLKAYQQGRDYYPGINAATLYLLLKKPAASSKLAGEILADLEQQKPAPPEELTWILATKAEANLLLGNCEDAALLYEQAIERPDCKPHHRSTMLKQVNRILSRISCIAPGFDPATFESILK